MGLRELRARLAETNERARAYHEAHSAAWTAENQTEWDAIQAEYDRVNAEITRLQAIENQAALLAGSAGRPR